MPRAGALCKIGRTTRAFIAEASTERGGRAQEADENWRKTSPRGGGITGSSFPTGYSTGSPVHGFHIPNLNHGQDTRANRTRHTTSSSTQSHAKQQHTNATQTHLTFKRTHTSRSNAHTSRSAPARGTIACAMHRGWAKPETHGFQPKEPSLKPETQHE